MAYLVVFAASLPWDFISRNGLNFMLVYSDFLVLFEEMADESVSQVSTGTSCWILSCDFLDLAIAESLCHLGWTVKEKRRWSRVRWENICSSQVEFKDHLLGSTKQHFDALRVDNGALQCIEKSCLGLPTKILFSWIMPLSLFHISPRESLPTPVHYKSFHLSK
jgi:hypothetical protein